MKKTKLVSILCVIALLGLCVVPMAGCEEVEITPEMEDLIREELAKLQGEQGEPGLAGPQGELGPAGSQGEPGPAGPSGPQGNQGSAGPAGSQGEPGPQGEVGPTGSPGPKGSPGSRGSTGATGATGPAGLQGEQGSAGPQGEIGATGATGPQGELGPQGEPGPQGEQGIQGEVGPAGSDGATPMFQVSLEATGGGSASLNSTTVQSGSFSIKLGSGSVPGGAEGRIVLIPLKPMSLNQVQSILWSIYSAMGYPAHVDITLDCDQDGVVDDEDMLTAEMAYNCVGAPWDIVPLCISMTYPTGWLQTFELTSGDGFGAVDDSSILWVTKMGAGDDDAPWGTLADWKAGTVANDPGNDGLAAGVITGDVMVVKLEIEVDNWVANSTVYIDNIIVNGQIAWSD